MRDEYKQALDEAMRLVSEAKDACNHVVDVADESEEGGPIYDWAHNSYHDLLDMLYDGRTSQRIEP